MPYGNPEPTTTDIQPVSFGGTSSIAEYSATDELQLLTNINIGVATGAVPLDENAKVPLEYLEGLSTGHGDTIQLNLSQVYGGQIIDNLAFITNYDCQRIYNVTTNYDNNGAAVTFFSRDSIEQAERLSPGSMSRISPGMISLQFPNITGLLELTINNQVIPIQVLEAHIDKPTIVERFDVIPPSEGGERFLIAGFHNSINYNTYIGVTNPTFLTGYYQNNCYVQIEIANDSTFQDIIFSANGILHEPLVLIDEMNLIDAFILFFPDTSGGQYFPLYARAKYIGESLSSPWSDAIAFDLRVSW